MNREQLKLETSRSLFHSGQRAYDTWKQAQLVQIHPTQNPSCSYVMSRSKFNRRQWLSEHLSNNLKHALSWLHENPFIEKENYMKIFYFGDRQDMPSDKFEEVTFVGK